MVSEKLKKQIDRFLLAIGFSLMFGIMLLGQRFQRGGRANSWDFFESRACYCWAGEFPSCPFSNGNYYRYLCIPYPESTRWTGSSCGDTQERMKSFQAEFREAQLSQNTYMLKKLEEQRKDMMEDQMKMSKQQFKPMAYISIISVPLIMWIYYYISGHGSATMIFPFWGKQLLTSQCIWPVSTLALLVFYFLSGVSQLIRKALNIGGV